MLSGYLRNILVLLFAIAAFLFATAPAWLMATLISFVSSGIVQLEEPLGSFWNGRAAALHCTFPNGSRQRLTHFSWDILIGDLLHGQITANVTLDDSRLSADGVVALNTSGSFLNELQALATADVVRAAVPVLDMWSPGGTLYVRTGKVTLKPFRLDEPAILRWAGASISIAKLPPLGDYELNVAPEGDKLKLNLKTVKGALLITGSGQYALKSGGEFYGKFQAAPGFGNQLVPILKLMGPMGSDGGVNLTVPLPRLQ